jgi:hypothetical protein
LVVARNQNHSKQEISPEVVVEIPDIDHEPGNSSLVQGLETLNTSAAEATSNPQRPWHTAGIGLTENSRNRQPNRCSGRAARLPINSPNSTFG